MSFSVQLRALAPLRLLCLSILVALAPSRAAVDDGTVLHHGEATYYGEGGFGHCGFPAALQPQFHGAMNHVQYDNASSCGTWVRISGPKGEITAYIDDECPECQEGDIDLGPTAFSHIAEMSAGRVPISWRYVQAPVSGPVRFYWKEGSSRWHIEIQVLDHLYGITRLELRTSESDWVSLQREVYNFFKLPGGIAAQPGPFDIRITDVFGRQIIEMGVPLIESTYHTAAGNFPVFTETSTLVPLSARNSSRRQVFKVMSLNGVLTLPLTGFSRADVFSVQGKQLGRLIINGSRLLVPNQFGASTFIVHVRD